MAACYAGMNLVGVRVGGAEGGHCYRWVVQGRMLFAYGWSEPDIGADLASIKTTAVREGDMLVVNGAKRFCSGAAFCDYIYTLVRTGAPGDRRRNLSFVLIAPSTPGVTIEPIDAMGMKGPATTDVTFADVRIPVANLVGGEAGWKWRLAHADRIGPRRREAGSGRDGPWVSAPPPSRTLWNTAASVNSWQSHR